MKKVYICKVFDEGQIEDKISKLVVKSKKRFGNNVKVYCTDNAVRLKLAVSAITSEYFPSFFSDYAADEPIWEEAYRLSDALRNSSEKTSHLKYHGINILTLEYNILSYISIIQFSHLCRKVAAQNCDVLILILLSPSNIQLRDIKTKNIRTIHYYRSGVRNSHFITRLKTVFGKVRTVLLQVVKSVYLSISPLFHILFRRPGNTNINTNDHKAEIFERNKTAMFVVTNKLHVPSTLSIYDSCIKNGLNPQIITDDASIVPSLQSGSYKYSYRNLAFSFIPYLPVIFVTNLGLRSRIKKFFYNNVGYNNLTDEFATAYLCQKNLLHDSWFLCAEAIFNITFLEKTFNKISPDVVCVLPDMYFFQQLAVTIAKKQHIPTLTCSVAWDFALPSALLRRFHVDKIATMGEKVKRAYLASGIQPDRVVITGVAHFDRMLNRDKEKDIRFLKDARIDPDSKYIIFATQHSIVEMEEMLKGVIEAVIKIPDMQLVVKVHPAEEIGKYRAITDKYNAVSMHVVKDIDLYALIYHCQLFITQFSTTALEAMMIGKPVITINLSGKPVPVPYSEEGASYGVFKYGDIESAVFKVLYDEEVRLKLKSGRDRFVREWAGEPDGKASQRIVNLMKMMIEDAKSNNVK